MINTKCTITRQEIIDIECRVDRSGDIIISREKDKIILSPDDARELVTVLRMMLDDQPENTE